MSVLLATAELLLMANFFFTENDSHQHLNGFYNKTMNDESEFRTNEIFVLLFYF